MAQAILQEHRGSEAEGFFSTSEGLVGGFEYAHYLVRCFMCKVVWLELSKTSETSKILFAYKKNCFGVSSLYLPEVTAQLFELIYCPGYLGKKVPKKQWNQEEGNKGHMYCFVK